VAIVAPRAWNRTGAPPSGDEAAPLLPTPTEDPAAVAPDDPGAELAELRRQADGPGLDAFVAACTQRAAARPEDPEVWRMLAEAHLERLLWRDRNRGMSRGEPTHASLPDAHRADLDAGLAAADRAIALDDPSGDAWRIRGALLSLSVTGLGSLMKVRGDVQKAYAEAARRQPGNPRLAYLRAAEKLFTPGWLGGDPAAAASRLEEVAAALPTDERPLVALAYARHLQGERAACLDALDEALERAPANRYAAEVARRIRAGETEPFARDVED
jgi:tetratricopeptide (TPR) repeat protein